MAFKGFDPDREQENYELIQLDRKEYLAPTKECQDVRLGELERLSVAFTIVRGIWPVNSVNTSETRNAEMLQRLTSKVQTY